MARVFKMSASSISALKKCPTAFRLAYREGIRKEEDPDALRVGTHWHALHEVYQNALGEHEDRMDAVLSFINQAYAEVPQYKEAFEWGVEKLTLLYSFVGYHWYWANDPITYLHNELAFDFPILNTKTGEMIPLDEAVAVGKIDHVVEYQGMIGNVERKSTGSDLAQAAELYGKSSQISMYAYGFRRVMDTLPIDFTGKRIGNTLLDIWRKPTIRPKWLTQKETAEFVETGVYCGVELPRGHQGNYESKEGKGGISIRETPEMFAARLLQDIQERPEHYFLRKEIARTDDDLRRFEKDLHNLYIASKMYEENDCWFENETACRNPFPCSYIPICYGPGSEAVCDGETVPPGFKRIFEPLTVNGEDI